MDVRLISKNRTPMPMIAISGGKVIWGEVLYPNIARWIKVHSPDPADTLCFGKVNPAKPTDPTELYYWSIWKTGLEAMIGRSDAIGATVVPDIGIEVMNFGPSIDVAMTPSSTRILKGEVKMLASVGSIAMNESGTQP